MVPYEEGYLRNTLLSYLVILKINAWTKDPWINGKYIDSIVCGIDINHGRLVGLIRNNRIFLSCPICGYRKNKVSSQVNNYLTNLLNESK